MALPPPVLEEGATEVANKSRKRLIIFAVQIAVALVITLVLTEISFDYVESLFYDMRVRYRIQPHASGNIELVMTDSETIKRFKAVPGFKEHTLVLEKIKQFAPAAVVYIRPFAPLKEEATSGDLQRAFLLGGHDEKLRFAEAASQINNFYLLTDSMHMADEQKKLTLMPPFENLNVGSGPRTSDRNILAQDGVSRRLLISYQGQTLLHYKIATLFNSNLEDQTKVRGLEDLFDAKQVYVDFVPQGSFHQTKFEDIVDGKADTSRFKGKLILFGDDIGASARDYVSTPFNRDADMTVTELQANMFDTLIRNSAAKKAPHSLDFVLTLLIAFLTLSISLSMKPAKGIFTLLATTLGFVMASWFSFTFLGIWIEMTHPIVAVFICYYFFIPYRLIIENRRSWEYYQKHKLLQQVEEMKTNFISMMSHDLKTPIARIQGMASIVSKDKNLLSSPQQEAIETIRSSSSDLLDTINSILNYAKIENQGVELHLQARDINELVIEVVRRHEFLASLKHIKISTELDPLFSLSVDPELIKQVFSNLLENAIKYSPENSSVKIKTQEIQGFVTVEFIDTGNGIPEDELPSVFMKFFRSKNAKSSPVKGSGLGLYLARYLIELHKGDIFVQSTAGKGTTFTVKLPL